MVLILSFCCHFVFRFARPVYTLLQHLVATQPPRPPTYKTLSEEIDRAGVFLLQDMDLHFKISNLGREVSGFGTEHERLLRSVQDEYRVYNRLTSLALYPKCL
jgi:hypothetical protein